MPRVLPEKRALLPEPRTPTAPLTRLFDEPGSWRQDVRHKAARGGLGLGLRV